MLLLLAAVPAGVLIGWLRHGSLLGIRDVHWRGGVWILVALLLRTALTFWVPARILEGAEASRWALGGYLLTYGSLGAVAAMNRRVPGALLFALGAGSNLVAIVAAGGNMPYWIRAAQIAAGSTAAIAPPQLGHMPVAHLSGLLFLADIIPFPGPLASVVSAGDVLMAAGAFWVCYRLMIGHGLKPREEGNEEVHNPSSSDGASL